MSTKKILLFILACLLLLGGLAYFFPSDGISVGKFHLSFPSLKEVLTPSSGEKDLAIVTPDDHLQRMEEAFYWKNLSDLADSLDYYGNFFKESDVRIEFPDNDPSLFDSLFIRLERASEGKGTVHVVHYGDSQIEQDRLTATFRRSWQDLFGGSGPGLVPAIQPIPTPTISQSYSGNWQRSLVYGPASGRASHRRYGPLGAVCTLADTGQIVVGPRYPNQPDPVKRFSHVRLLIGQQSADFQAQLTAGHFRQTRHTQGQNSRLEVLEWQLPTAQQRVQLRMSGSAEIYGLILEDSTGVSVDNVPMRGCSGTVFTRIDKALLKAVYEEMDVALFILQFGGNRVPIIHSEKDIASYVANLEKQILMFQELLPDAAILFIGPADMSVSIDGQKQTYPMLEPTIEAIRRLCLDNGVAFWDMYHVMGGHNSMLQWVKAQPQLAASDYTHFTVKGARRMASLLDESLSVCYDRFRLCSQIDTLMWQDIGHLDREHDYRADYEREKEYAIQVMEATDRP